MQVPCMFVVLHVITHAMQCDAMHQNKDISVKHLPDVAIDSAAFAQPSPLAAPDEPMRRFVEHAWPMLIMTASPFLIWCASGARSNAQASIVAIINEVNLGIDPASAIAFLYMSRALLLPAQALHLVNRNNEHVSFVERKAVVPARWRGDRRMVD